MKILSYEYPKSAFLSIEKDMGIIFHYISKNQILKKLLHYTTPDCLSQPNLTDEETIELFNKEIKMVPKLYVDGSVLNYLIISFDNFYPSATNPQFRDNIIEFDIICHMDQWNLGNFQLRPYRIAGELDSMLDGAHLTGIGTLEFAGANQIILTDEYAGLCLMYRAVHGEEDKNSVNTSDPEFINSFIERFGQPYPIAPEEVIEELENETEPEAAGEDE